MKQFRRAISARADESRWKRNGMQLSAEKEATNAPSRLQDLMKLYFSETKHSL